MVKALTKQVKLDAFAKETIAKSMQKRKEIQQMYTLPEEWKWVSLSELLVQKPQYGLTARSESRGQVLYLRITDIDDFGRLKSTGLRYVNIDKETFAKYAICPGDILIARSGATAGKAFLCKKQMNAVFASYLIRFRVNKERILPEYLFYFLHSNTYWKQLRSWKVGGAQPNVNAQNIKRLKIPLAPLDEQRRIVSRLEQLIGRVEEAKRLRKVAKEETEKIMESAINKVFNKAEEKKWKWVKLNEICCINREKRDPTKKIPDKEFLYIDISSVEEGTGRIVKIKKILGKDAPSRARRVVHTNDVIMSTVRPYLKSFAIITEEYDNQICSTGFAVLSCQGKVIPKYLLYALFSDIVISQCNDMMVGAHYPALRFDQVAKIKIPLAPLDEQKKIVIYLNKIKETADSLRKLQQSTDEKLEKLVPTILHKAFRGEL